MHCIEGSLYDEAVASLPDTQRLVLMPRGGPGSSLKVIQEIRGLDRGRSMSLLKYLKYSLIPVRIYRKTLPVRGINRAFWTRLSSFI